VADRFDFVVIGAGIAGVSVAAELAAESRVGVLEMEASPGLHATGRSAAVYTELYGNAAIRALTRASREFFLSPRTGSSAFATDRGCLYIAREDQLELLRQLATLPDVISAATCVQPPAIRTLVPFLRPNYAAAAVYEPRAYDLDVNAIHQYYLRLLKDRGGRLFCSAALEVAMRQDGLWNVRCAGTEICAPVLINAAGAWGDAIAEAAGVQRVGLQPMKRTAVVVEAPASNAFAGAPCVIDIGENFYFKPHASKLLLSPADETPSEPCDAYADDFDVAVAIDRVQQVADFSVQRAPKSWAGLRTFAPDRTPIVGFDPDIEGFFWHVGQGGYGIQTAPAIARFAANLALRRPVPTDLLEHGLDPSALAVSRFRTGMPTLP
jgi:D-arginine dehydrogenase